MYVNTRLLNVLTKSFGYMNCSFELAILGLGLCRPVKTEYFSDREYNGFI